MDHIQTHELHHDLVKDLHVFDSHVTGHLPRTHPHVTDTTDDDLAEEGFFLGNDLTPPNFWMYNIRAEKVMMLSDPIGIISCLSCTLGMFPIVLI